MVFIICIKFNNLYTGFKEFLIKNDLTHNDTEYFKIYFSITVELTDIIRISESFYDNKWFSDISITSEETVWYEKVYIYSIYIYLLIFIIELIIKFLRYIMLI
jgi:hypothetical protein